VGYREINEKKLAEYVGPLPQRNGGRKLPKVCIYIG
jgi:hypothetical protein